MTITSELDAAAAGTDDDKPNRLIILRLIQRARAGATPADLSEIHRTDPVLCYALLAELGSTGAVPTRYVTTCRQAIEITGVPALIEWLEAALEHAISFPRFSDQMRDTLIRARFMELMGRSTMMRDDTEDLYLVGLFSRLNRLLGMPLAELILPLPFPEEMQAAILEQRGRIGRLLKFARTIESADESGIGFMQTNMHLPAVQVYDAYNEAYDWMIEVESQSTTGP
jgi:EAL and modified HD-GYP domain-containing signal transduction protein